MSDHTTQKTSRRKSSSKKPAPAITAVELLRLGGGHLAYIRTMTSDQARVMFPAVEGLPQGTNLYALHAADGTPIALTDSMQAAVGHAMGDDLEIATLH